ncbi:MAG: hypothetical protein ABI183_04510, partial [Polyangiaceae bacterium]
RAADATEIFTRASLPPSMAPSKPKPRPSIPPPSLPPQRSVMRSAPPPIPVAAPTTRDVHEVETVVGIPSDPYASDVVSSLSDSNEVYTQVMGESERAALIAEANPQQAKTDEHDLLTEPQISGLDYDEDAENEPTVAQPPPSADLTVPYPSSPVVELNPDATVPIPTRRKPPRGSDYEERRPPRTERMPERDQREQVPASTTNVGPPPEMTSRPPPSPIQDLRREMHGDDRALHSTYDGDRPPTVEINATPPPMSAVDARQVVSDGYLRIPAQQFPGQSSFPPPQPHMIPPTAQTYMISPKAPYELSTAAWLFALAIAVAGIAVIYESWSHSQTNNVNPADSVTPATATIPTASALAPTGTSMGMTVNPQDLPESMTGVVPQTPTPHRGGGRPSPRGRGKPATPAQPPPTTDPTPPAPLVAGGSGFLTVICTPACDDVLDGNSSLGPSPVFKAQVRSGSHRITLKTTDPPSTKVVSVTVPTDDTAVVKQAMGAN